jgi:hypothetical protein
MQGRAKKVKIQKIGDQQAHSTSGWYRLSPPIVARPSRILIRYHMNEGLPQELFRKKNREAAERTIV